MSGYRTCPLVVLGALLAAVLSSAATPASCEEQSPLQKRLERLGRGDQVRLATVGMFNDGEAMSLLLARNARLDDTSRMHLLLVGLTGGSSDGLLDLLEWFDTSPEAAPHRRRFHLSALPLDRPAAPLDRPAAPLDRPAASQLAQATFPPSGKAYSDPRTGELLHLWRGLGMLAPDLVLEVRVGDTGHGWFVPEGNIAGFDKLAEALQPRSAGQPAELAAALVQHDVCQVGRIPALRLTTSDEQLAGKLKQLLTAMAEAEFQRASPARVELQHRLARTPLQVAEQLSAHYGHDLKQVVYIPALALVGRLRLGELTADESHRQDVERIVQPYVAERTPPTPNSGSGLSGHSIFAELAERSKGDARQKYIDLARRAADLAFDREGRIRPLMPFHSEMSDALFMGGPILAQVGHLTGDPRYYDACLQHLRSMRKLVLRPDGLYRHSPLDDAAWGRGNGFPALGLAWCLTYWPEQREDRAELLEMFREHMTVLAGHQDQDGCWHQVVDREPSYRELSCSCMICFAMTRGVRRGWLDATKFTPCIERAWEAILRRVAADGRLVDVCTGTGKQSSLQDYYDREAILGHDPRGGAMALLVATEMASDPQAAKVR